MVCQRSFLPLLLRFQENYFEQWICYVSEIIIGQIMTFRNIVLVYLSQYLNSIQTVFENHDSSVEHWLATCVFLCLSEITNLGKCIPVFQTAEKTISLTPRGILTLMSHFRAGLDVPVCCYLQEIVTAANYSKPITTMCLMTLLSYWILSAFSWAVGNKTAAGGWPFHQTFFTVWFNNSVEVSSKG